MPRKFYSSRVFQLAGVCFPVLFHLKMGWWPWQFHDSPAKIFPSNTITLRPARPQPLQCNQRKTVEQVYQHYHLAFMRWRIFQTGSLFILTRTRGVRCCHYPHLTTKEKKSQRDDITWPRSRRCKSRSRIWIRVCQTIKPTFLSAMGYWLCPSVHSLSHFNAHFITLTLSQTLGT